MRKRSIRTGIMAIVLSAVFAVTATMPAVASKALADVGQPELRIPTLDEVNCASYCVYDSGYRNDGDWALNIRSVIVFGRIEIVEDHDRALAVSRALSYKFTGDEDYIEKEVQFAGHRVLAFALSIEHMSGKLVNEK